LGEKENWDEFVSPEIGKPQGKIDFGNPLRALEYAQESVAKKQCNSSCNLL